MLPARAAATSPSNSTAPAGVVTLSATTSGRAGGLPRAGVRVGDGVHVKMMRRPPPGSTVRPNHDSMNGLRRRARVGNIGGGSRRAAAARSSLCSGAQYPDRARTCASRRLAVT